MGREYFDFARIDKLFLIASEKVELPKQECVLSCDKDEFLITQNNLYKIGAFDIVGRKTYQWTRKGVFEDKQGNARMSLFKYDCTYIDWEIYLGDELKFNYQEAAECSDYVVVFTLLMVEDFLINKLKEVKGNKALSKFFKIKNQLEEIFVNGELFDIEIIKKIVGKEQFNNIAKEYFAKGKEQRKKVKDTPLEERFKDFQKRLKEKQRQDSFEELAIGFNPRYYLDNELFDTLSADARRAIIKERLKKIQKRGDDVKRSGLVFNIDSDGSAEK